MPRTEKARPGRSSRKKVVSQEAALYQALKRHFRFVRGKDNLPILATPRAGRNNGRLGLANTMADLGFTRGLEIGTRYGQSARTWLDIIPGLELVCIDPYQAYHHTRQSEQEKIYADAQANLAEYRNVALLRITSRAAVHSFEDGSLDFVYIDGDHTFDEAAQDIIQYAPKVRPGGLVLVHDYCSFLRSGVIQAVDAYTHCHRIEPWYVTRDYEPTAVWQRGTERAG